MTDEAPTRSGLEDALRAPVRAVLDRPSRALTSAVAERVAEILIEEGVVERVVDKALQSPEVERAAIRVVDSELVDEITERLLTSDEMQQIVERIANAPEVRAAITRQGVGLLDDLRRELGKAARHGDRTVERPFRWVARRPRREGQIPFAGAVTRGLALVLDAAIVNGALLGISALLALIASALDLNGPGTVEAVIAGTTAWIVSSGLYLIFFWTLTGQTPGMRFMDLRLQRSDGSGLRLGGALLRLFGMVLGALLFFTGYIAVLFTERRRALHDRMADTVVLYRERGGEAT